jgi:hypothetical protein
MIISHKQKIIFIKTKKVSGTSFEIALSKFCGDDCVITPIGDTTLRKKLVEREAINFKKPGCHFFNHQSAGNVRKHIDKKIWNEYKKVSMCRNPFDMVISMFFYRNRMAKNKIDNKKINVMNDIKVVKQNLEIAPPNLIDVFLKYENIEEDIKSLGIDGLWEVYQSSTAKKNFRPENFTIEYFKENYKEHYDIIKSECREYIELFGYEDY